MDRTQVTHWVEAYERAWRSPGTRTLEAIFAADASYRQGPYREPVRGLADIGRMWQAERDGPDEVFTMASEIVAVDGDTAVVRVEVRYGDPVVREYLDLWIVRFSPDGRCHTFEEWPFSPTQPIAAPDGSG